MEIIRKIISPLDSNAEVYRALAHNLSRRKGAGRNTNFKLLLGIVAYLLRLLCMKQHVFALNLVNGSFSTACRLLNSGRRKVIPVEGKIISTLFSAI